MTLPIRKYFAFSKDHLDLNIFLPLFFILTLIALVHSLQSFYTLQTGNASGSVLFTILLSKLIYYWYFSLVAFVIQYHSKWIRLSRQTFVRWLFIHLTTLALSFFVHELLSLSTGRLIGGIRLKATLWYIVFNNPSVWIEMLVYILFLLTFTLIEYRKMSQENEIRCAQLEVQLIRSKLQEIRNKIHPSFLFNTRQTIQECVRLQSNKDANHILSLLSDFLRTTVYDNERDEITLEEELRFLNQYLEIQKVRSVHTLNVHEDIEQGVLNAIVPNFILQPIVEEIVYQNTGRDMTQHEISIKAGKDGGQLEIMIQDLGMENAGSSADKKENRVLFDITKERLSHLYGERQSLTVQWQQERGVQVNIQIPFKEMTVESEETFIVESAL